ncbi:hypothetical protein D3C72_951590 [compost metagenome]
MTAPVAATAPAAIRAAQDVVGLVGHHHGRQVAFLVLVLGRHALGGGGGQHVAHGRDGLALATATAATATTAAAAAGALLDLVLVVLAGHQHVDVLVRVAADGQAGELGQHDLGRDGLLGDLMHHRRVAGLAAAGLVDVLLVEEAAGALAAGAGALGAGGGELLEQVLALTATRHLDQAVLREAGDLRAALVFLERVVEGGEHLVAIARVIHGDEVDHDDAADVAQAELAGHLDGGLHVGAQHRVRQGAALGETARVHVDDGQGLGVLDDEIAARRQPNLGRNSGLQFFANAITVQNRLGPAVVTDVADELRHPASQDFTRLLRAPGGVDHDLADVGGRGVAQHPVDQVAVAVKQRRRVNDLHLVQDVRPNVDELFDVLAQVLLGPADGLGADDQPVAGVFALEGQAAQPIALGGFHDAPRDRHAVVVGHEHQKPAGDGQPAGQARALVAGGRLGDLNEDALFDPNGRALRRHELAGSLGGRQIGDVDEAVALLADVDEGRLDAGHDGLDLPPDDVAHQLIAASEEELGRAAVLEHDGHVVGFADDDLFFQLSASCFCIGGCDVRKDVCGEAPPAVGWGCARPHRAIGRRRGGCACVRKFCIERANGAGFAKNSLGRTTPPVGLLTQRLPGVRAR